MCECFKKKEKGHRGRRNIIRAFFFLDSSPFLDFFLCRIFKFYHFWTRLLLNRQSPHTSLLPTLTVKRILSYMDRPLHTHLVDTYANCVGFLFTFHFIGSIFIVYVKENTGKDSHTHTSRRISTLADHVLHALILFVSLGVCVMKHI